MRPGRRRWRSTSTMAMPWCWPIRPSSSSARSARPPCATTSMPPSWRSPWPISPAAPCISTSRCSRPRRAATSSPTRSAATAALFRSHVAGLQRFLPQVMPLLAPNVNSFRRLRPYSDAPINVQWGVDNRSVGLRVPISDGPARRIENRLAGADANPYLAIAASLACGYLGMIERMKPTKQIEGSAYRLPHTLPRTLYEALQSLQQRQEDARHIGRPLHARHDPGEAVGARGLSGRHQLLGARASAAERLITTAAGSPPPRPSAGPPFPSLRCHRDTNRPCDSHS